MFIPITWEVRELLSTCKTNGHPDVYNNNETVYVKATRASIVSQMSLSECNKDQLVTNPDILMFSISSGSNRLGVICKISRLFLPVSIACSSVVPDYKNFTDSDTDQRHSSIKHKTAQI